MPGGVIVGSIGVTGDKIPTVAAAGIGVTGLQIPQDAYLRSVESMPVSKTATLRVPGQGDFLRRDGSPAA